jgi:GNAT superfamily N-acetyltransferase
MIVVINNIEADFRDATATDIPLLLSFIRSMAVFEKLTVTATEEWLRAALFGEAPAARVLLAFVNGEPIAYATYFFTFTMVGRRGLWLDDLFVIPAFRGKGIGRAIMAYLADIAIRHKCGRFEWTVLDRNETAIGFYKSLGANILTNWWLCRLEEAQLTSVAGRLPIGHGGEHAVPTDENRQPVS